MSHRPAQATYIHSIIKWQAKMHLCSTECGKAGHCILQEIAGDCTNQFAYSLSWFAQAPVPTE